MWISTQDFGKQTLRIPWGVYRCMSLNFITDNAIWPLQSLQYCNSPFKALFHLHKQMYIFVCPLSILEKHDLKIMIQWLINPVTVGVQSCNEHLVSVITFKLDHIDLTFLGRWYHICFSYEEKANNSVTFYLAIMSA